MVAASKDANVTRRATILEAAVPVFLRYGFKKTSMDDLARAAGLSRQGLYLHFPTKDGLFKEGLLHMVSSMREAARGALAREDASVEERILGAFDALHGQHAGQIASEHMNELLETAATLIGPIVSELDDGALADVARVLRASGVAAKWKDAGISAKDLADTLFSASYGIKHRVTTPAAYRERMRTAVQLVCARQT